MDSRKRNCNKKIYNYFRFVFADFNLWIYKLLCRILLYRNLRMITNNLNTINYSLIIFCNLKFWDSGGSVMRDGSYLIGHIKLLSGRILNRLFIKNGFKEFNGEQGKILYALWKEDGISTTSLSKRTGLANNSLTKMLDLMEEKGLIRREFCDKDKRKKLICITDKGRNLEKKTAEINAKMEEVFYRGFSDKEIERFEEDLKRILDNLNRWERRI